MFIHFLGEKSQLQCSGNCHSIILVFDGLDSRSAVKNGRDDLYGMDTAKGSLAAADALVRERIGGVGDTPEL